MTTAGAKRLARYLFDKRMSQARMASLVGAHQTTISGLLHGSRPSLELALAIERATKTPASMWTRTLRAG